MKKKFLFIIMLACVVCSAAICKSQTGVDEPSLRKADALIEKFMQKYSIGAGSMAITKNGNLVYNRSFGFSDLAQTDSAAPYNLYRIMSLSKQYTSIAIMKMMQDGRLNLNDTVFGMVVKLGKDSTFPDHKLYLKGTVIASKKRLINRPYYIDTITDQRIYKITVRELLEHNAGWNRDTSCDGFSSCDPHTFPLHVAKAMNRQNPVGDSTLIKFLLAKGLDTVPGTKYAYSNIGYLILGKIIDTLSKKYGDSMSYEKYIRDSIFTPVHADDIYLGKNIIDSQGILIGKHEREVDYIGNQTTLSCYGTGEKVRVQYGGFNIEAMNSFGGWIATAEDMVKVLLSVDTTYRLSYVRHILTNASIDTMMTESSIHKDYAKGWDVNDTTRFHNGRENGTATEQYITMGRDAGYTCVILFNRRVNNKAFDTGQYNLGWQCMKIIKADTALRPDYNLFPPDTNASIDTPIQASITSANISWNSRGSGTGRIIIAAEADSIKSFPVDGRDYTANNIYGRGSNLGHNCYVVYNGTNNMVTNVTVEGLNPLKTYTFTAIEYYKNGNTLGKPVYKYGNRSTVSICTSPYKRTQ